MCGGADMPWPLARFDCSLTKDETALVPKFRNRFPLDGKATGTTGRPDAEVSDNVPPYL